jgi:hypothetical protein
MVTMIVKTNASGSMLRLGDKQIEIRVENSAGRLFFVNSGEYVAAGISSEVIWSEFPNVSILIYEYGSDKLDDEYSRHLVDAGKKLISEYHITLE